MDQDLILIFGFILTILMIVMPMAYLFQKRAAEHEERKLELAAMESSDQSAHFAAQAQKLQARVRVLARISTDREVQGAAALANLAAGVVVGKAGTAVPLPTELKAALSPEPKIVDREAALERLAHWRRDGDRIVFTNGCFDLIHPGHVALLAPPNGAG